MNDKIKIMPILGIRPDFIRTSVLLKKMASNPSIEMCLVATGQHYDKELKDIFFDDMKLPRPNVVLDTKAETHSQQHAKLISQLEKPIDDFKPDLCLFLGDANAVMGCITALKKKVPIAHIEAGMRSYDWNMPEERNRVIVDRVSDVLFTYHENYKINLIREGVNPSKIFNVGNILVDVISEYAMDILELVNPTLEAAGVESGKYVLMTMHRDEHVSNPDIARHIVYSVAEWSQKRGLPVVWPIMPRAAAIKYDHSKLRNFIFTKPLGFFEFMSLESSATIEFTDSGTNQESASLLGTPAVITRMCTERPETFASNISTMERENIGEAADWVIGRKKATDYGLGDGTTSIKIIDHLLQLRSSCLMTDAKYVDPSILSHYISVRQ